jgi:hypothetical protein
VAAWPFVPDTAGRVRALLGRPPAPTRWALDAGPPRVPGPPDPPLRRGGDQAPIGERRPSRLP